MNDPLDLLQIKIDKAKTQLPAATKQAIESTDWKKSLLEMRTRRGYTFEQLASLEIETELLLCGLISPENYPRELEARMKIPKAKVDELVKDMNELVFGKIREELIKISERNQKSRADVKPDLAASTKPDLPGIEMPKHEEDILSRAGIQIILPETQVPPIKQTVSIKDEDKKPEIQPQAVPVQSEVKNLEPARQSVPKVATLLTQKLSSSFQMPKVETDHSLTPASGSEKPKIDPYREMPE